MSILATAPNSTRHFDMNIAEALESIEAAIILQQLHYWTNKEGIGEIIGGKKFIHNTFREWVSQQFRWLTSWKFRQAMNILRNLSIVEVIRHKSRQWNQTNYYNLNYKKLQEWAEAESIEISELCNSSPQDEKTQTLEMKKNKLSLIETKNTNQRETTKHVAAPLKSQLTANQPLNQPKVSKLELTAKISQINPRLEDKNPGQPINLEESTVTAQINQLKRAEIPINKTILNLLETYPAEETKQAIALVEARRKEKYISNPAGYFIAALKENWGDKAEKSNQETRDAEQWVYLSGVWEKWSEAQERGYSIEYLRKIKKRNRRK